MKSYLRILAACANEPWAMQYEKLQAISQFLRLKADGLDRSPEEKAAILEKRREREVARNAGTVAILPIYGVIAQRMNMFDEISGGSSCEMIARNFRALLADDAVKAIVLDIDSPGGTVYGIPELAAEMLASRGIKPIIAQVNSVAASAAYWLASSADEVVITPSGQAGSIGVYSIHKDISEMLKMEGIKETLIYAGKYKVEGNEFEPLGEEARDFMQQRVDSRLQDFIAAVAEGRGVEKSVVATEYGEGRVFTAKECLKRGMVDRIATLDETLERFGIQTRPALAKKRESSGSRAETGAALKEKLLAGVQPERRELENGLKGLLGLSNSEAEQAALLLLPGKTHGGREEVADKPVVSVAALNEGRAALADISSILKI